MTAEAPGRAGTPRHRLPYCLALEVRDRTGSPTWGPAVLAHYEETDNAYRYSQSLPVFHSR